MSFASALGAISGASGASQLGAAAGALDLLGAFRGQDQTTGMSTSTSSSTPFQQESYRRLLDRAEALYGQQYGPEFLNALDQERYNLSQGKGLSQQAIGVLQKMLGPDSAITRTAEGAYMDPNSQEYKDRYELATRGYREQFTDTIMPQLNNQAMQAGRWGSPAQQRQVNQAGKVLGQQLADVNVRMAEQERDRQMQALNTRANLAGKLGQYQGSTANRLQQIDPRSIQLASLGQYKDLITGSMGNRRSDSKPYSTGTPNKYTRLGNLLSGGVKLYEKLENDNDTRSILNRPVTYGTLGGF